MSRAACASASGPLDARPLPGSDSPATIRLGLQAETLEGARVFVLPNPSGRNANFSYGEMLAAFRALRRYAIKNS